MTPRERFQGIGVPRAGPGARQLWPLPWVEQYQGDELRTVAEKFSMDIASPTGLTGGLGPGDRERGRQARKGVYVDAWGCAFHAAEDGVVGEVKGPPLADISTLATYRPPWEILERADWDAIDRACADNAAGAKKFMLAGTSVRPFERMQFLRGSENLYVDLGYETAELFRLRDMVHEFFLKELSQAVRTDADALSFMDDWGTQQSLLISPAQWRRVFKPLYRQYCDLIHAGGKKVFFHSDGHIFEIYEDLIEVGVDAVNSQLFCMDIEEIGRRFKGRITFWGEIDRQRILPFGTPAECRAAVARVRRALDEGAGGVIAQCEWGKHNPRENIEAVLEAWETPLDELAG